MRRCRTGLKDFSPGVTTAYTANTIATKDTFREGRRAERKYRVITEVFCGVADFKGFIKKIHTHKYECMLLY